MSSISRVMASLAAEVQALSQLKSDFPKHRLSCWALIGPVPTFESAASCKTGIDGEYMVNGSGKTAPTIGFLTVVEHPPHGLFGGLLILNLAGRPLEFHCTTPVKANRAQEILYGPTLKPYLYGEQISGALLAKLKYPPELVCTDCAEALAMREEAPCPVVWVSMESDTSDKTAYRIDASHSPVGNHHLRSFQLGSAQVSLQEKFADDETLIQSLWQDKVIDLDLCEPFTRIREAIEEAQAVGK